jgi:23S rRNA (cytosine1962-C5)-methyltransferase
MNEMPAAKFRDPALVDYGTDPAGLGRRLERFAGLLVDRPLPHVTGSRRDPAAWPEAAAVFHSATASTIAPPAGPAGRWEFRRTVPDPWRTSIPLGLATILLEIRPAPSGQIGIFLEQVAQWRWLAAVTPPGSVMLSLFGHSGAATLALAAAGAEVVHVDASRQALALARRNAEASGLSHLPIRWVCDDAAGFVRRQVRRGRGFSGAVIDPPSWGHGPRGEAFAIDRDLAPLVGDVARLVAAGGTLPRGPLLLTSHSSGWHRRRLRATLQEACTTAGVGCDPPEDGPLTCTDDADRTLDLGAYARCLPRS